MHFYSFTWDLMSHYLGDSLDSEVVARDRKGVGWENSVAILVGSWDGDLHSFIIPSCPLIYMM